MSRGECAGSMGAPPLHTGGLRIMGLGFIGGLLEPVKPPSKPGLYHLCPPVPGLVPSQDVSTLPNTIQ
jgi:hypothetical protein